MLGEPMMPTDNPGGGKSFWSKPEGRASIITNVIIGVVIFYFWGTIAPFVAQTFDDSLCRNHARLPALPVVCLSGDHAGAGTSACQSRPDWDS